MPCLIVLRRSNCIRFVHKSCNIQDEISRKSSCCWCYKTVPVFSIRRNSHQFKYGQETNIKINMVKFENSRLNSADWVIMYDCILIHSKLHHDGTDELRSDFCLCIVEPRSDGVPKALSANNNEDRRSTDLSSSWPAGLH